MRIAGYVDHPKYKITLLHMNNRYDVKIEYLGLEQHYKIRETEYFNQASQLEKCINEEFLSKVDQIFEQMLDMQNLIISNDDSDQEIQFLTDVI